MLSHEEALALGGCKHNLIPHVASMPLTQYGLYAAQIAWWMSFFPPDSFLILTREELMDPDRVFKVRTLLTLFVKKNWCTVLHSAQCQLRTCSLGKCT